jgi:hypothetical protein
MRGVGNIRKRGSIWYIRFYYRDKEYRESSHSENEADARRLLRKRLAEIGADKAIGPIAERIRFEDLASALLTD